MRIPNASPSPPKTWATTSISGAPSFTISVTPSRGASSRFPKGLPCGSQERRRTNTGAVHGARECLQRRLGAAPIRRIARHLRELREQEGRRGVGTGEHVVEHVFRPITQRRLGNREWTRGTDGVGARRRRGGEGGRGGGGRDV